MPAVAAPSQPSPATRALAGLRFAAPDQWRARVKLALDAAATKADAAGLLGIHRKTLWKWIREDAELREAYGASGE